MPTAPNGVRRPGTLWLGLVAGAGCIPCASGGFILKLNGECEFISVWFYRLAEAMNTLQDKIENTVKHEHIKTIVKFPKRWAYAELIIWVSCEKHPTTKYIESHWVCRGTARWRHPQSQRIPLSLNAFSHETQHHNWTNLESPTHLVLRNIQLF